MESCYSSRKRINLDLEKNYFMNMIIFIEKGNGSYSVKAIKEHFAVNHLFLANMIARYKGLLNIELKNNDTSKPENLIISINEDGKRFFFNNIETYMDLV